MPIKTQPKILIEQAIDAYSGDITRLAEDRSLVLGRIISEYTEWDYNKITEIFFAALKDANSHKERELLAASWLGRRRP